MLGFWEIFFLSLLKTQQWPPKYILWCTIYQTQCARKWGTVGLLSEALFESIHTLINEQGRIFSGVSCDCGIDIDIKMLHGVLHFISVLPNDLFFRHTGHLEVFHSHILMCAGKSCAFIPPVYKARCLLATIDYQIHKDRIYECWPNGDICSLVYYVPNKSVCQHLSQTIPRCDVLCEGELGKCG